MSQEHRHITELLIPQIINTSISYPSSSAIAIMQPATLLPNTSFEHSQPFYKYTYIPTTAFMSQTPSNTNEQAVLEIAVQEQLRRPLQELLDACQHQLTEARKSFECATADNKAKISDPDLFLKAENSLRVWLPRLTDEKLAKLKERNARHLRLNVGDLKEVLDRVCKMLQQNDRLEGWDEGPEEQVKVYLESKAEKLKELEGQGWVSHFDRAGQEARTELGELEYAVRWMMREIERDCGVGTSTWQEPGSTERKRGSEEMEGGLEDREFHVLDEGQLEEEVQGRKRACWGLHRVYSV